MKRYRKTVFVTGLPRSGTTVVGDVLAAGPRSISLYEPMNPQSGDVRFGEFFPIPGTGPFPEPAFDRFLADMQALRLRLRPGVFPHERGLRAMAKRLVGGRSRGSLRRSRLRPRAETLICKDPFALFCIPALLERGIPVVYTYRPPEAIAASFKRLHWTYPVDLIAGYLRERGWEALLDGVPESAPSGVSREVFCAAFLWCVANRLVAQHRRQSDQLVCVFTGDLPRAPMPVFEEVFSLAQVPLNAHCRQEIERRFAASGADKRAVPSGHPHTRKRDLKAVNTYWKEILTAEEAEFLAQICGPTRDAVEPVFAGQMEVAEAS